MNAESKSVSFSAEDFEKALAAHDYEFQKGQTVTGVIVDHATDGTYVDIGGKSSAFLPRREAGLKTVVDLSARFPLGEEREFLIIQDQNADGQVTLSVRQLELKHIWDSLEEQQTSKTVFQVKVTGTNRGGVMVDVDGLRGFIPRSHLHDKEGMESLKGQVITAALLEVSRDRNKVVLSQRLASQSEQFAQLEVGQLVTGHVMSLKPFGIFVDFEGGTGLLHINQISNKFVKDLSTFFSPGQPIKAVIADLDEGRGRIALSTKYLENHPGEILENLQEVMDSAESRLERAKKKLGL
ncbi:S1 RNA-binding domain-containing protein [Prochlorothrix hollandica]|uniref:S1 RNA-binding domain-containing protein n=1 Tax=Prochlorothrix hollandica TaxID=1223 RepID=UPI003340C250